MNFKSIHIQNFRGFKELQIDDFKKVNLFVGKNNTGKSSVLEALFLLCGASVPSLVFTIDSHRDIFSIIDNTLKTTLGLEKTSHYLKMIYYELNEKQNVSILGEFDNQKRKIQITPTYLKQNNQVNSEGTNLFINGYEYEYIQMINSKEKIYKISVSTNGLVINEKNDKNYSETFSGILLNPRNMNETHYAQLLTNFILNKEIKQVIDILNKVDNYIQNIVIDANGIIHCDTGLARMIPLSIMGDGIKRILSVILRIAQVKNGVMLIDEIDNGFHYSSMLNLWRAIFAASQKYNVQVFATTHSYECAQAYSEAYREIYGEVSDDIRLYRIERKEGGVHKSVKIDAESLKNIIESKWEIR